MKSCFIEKDNQKRLITCDLIIRDTDNYNYLSENCSALR